MRIVGVKMGVKQTNLTAKVVKGQIDLGNVVNDFAGDPVELCPFDFCFMQEKNIKTWIVVGFMPMTGRAALDPNVRHEVGDGGAPDETLA